MTLLGVFEVLKEKLSEGLKRCEWRNFRGERILHFSLSYIYRRDNLRNAQHQS